MTIEEILKQYKEGDLESDAVLNHLRDFPFAELDIAKFDHHRKLRKGFGEVIFSEGKQKDHLLTIVKHMKERNENVFLTRLSSDQAEFLEENEPGFDYDPLSRTAIYKFTPIEIISETVVPIVAAGTSDIPAATEAARTLEIMGHEVETIFDVGVAGIHRLYAFMDKLQAARVIVAVAGMEGALPGVIAGLVSAPVVALPTSVGYGTSLGGFSAMLTMLNSCAPGVAVVNIDNGFGAGYLAAMINKSAPR